MKIEAGEAITEPKRIRLGVADHSRSEETGADMHQFISEPITPHPGTCDTRAMGRGEPGLPSGFSWRDVAYDIREVLEYWKETSREGAHAQGQLYLRRHGYRLRMIDGSIWSVYFVRQTPQTGNPKARWFLYSIERSDDSAF